MPSWSSPYFNTVVASPRPARPMRYVINTSAAPEHVGGNEKLAASATFRRAGGVGGFGGAARDLGETATIVAHEGVLSRDEHARAARRRPLPKAAWPIDTFFDEFHKLSEYVNGEPVILYHAKAANTDGDSFVFFRHSEVIAAGNLFSTVSYPLIDIEPRAARIQGVIDGLNHILDLAVAEYRVAGRHVDRSGPRPAVGHRRCRVVPQHAGDDSRSHPRAEEEGDDARAGEGGAADARLRRALRRDDRRRGRRTCSSRRSTRALQEKK